MASRACIVRHRGYPGDPRTEIQIQALLEAGYEVDFLGVRRSGEPYCRVEKNVRVYRLPALERKRTSTFRYLVEYVTFLLTSFVFLALLQVQRNYQLIQVCNLPDFLVFAALIPKILGARIILDLRESTPEFYHTLYGTRLNSPLMKLVRVVEQKSIAFADAALTCTEPMRRAFVQRGANPDKVFVMLNAADPNLFQNPILPNPNPKQKCSFRIVTHGTITKRYGHDVLIRAMPLVLKEVPEACLDIMGQGNWQPELEQMVKVSGLEHAVTFLGHLPLDELLNHLRMADCGVVSLPRNIETDLIHTNKMHEYMALGIPVVISRTQAVEAYYDDSCLCFFEAGNEQDLARALISLHHHPQQQYNLAHQALRAYEKYSAPRQKNYYSNLIQNLVRYKLSGSH